MYSINVFSQSSREKEWGDPKIRLVMFTSTITVGVDFNTENTFDTGFVNANVGL